MKEWQERLGLVNIKMGWLIPAWLGVAEDGTFPRIAISDCTFPIDG